MERSGGSIGRTHESRPATTVETPTASARLANNYRQAWLNYCPAMTVPAASLLVRQLDLCVLAYQLYNQTLIFPLDPWYEEWARLGSDRRTNLMAELHRAESHYWGPGNSGGRPLPSNLHLDPILTDYLRICPTRPALTYDSESYRLFVPPPFADRIGPTYVSMLESDLKPRVALVSTPGDPDREDRPDSVYGFEGSTGAVKGNPGAWGLLGIVYVADLDDGSYEVHIAYRGSQSSSALRAAVFGFVLETANPDWVTDMEMIRLTQDPRVTNVGAAVEGFRNAMVDSIEPLGACLEHIAERRGKPPTSIHITGHSLGGGLAIQLAAGLTIGALPSLLPPPVRSWPWAELTLTTFGAPKGLDDEAAAEFNDRVKAFRVWLSGDPITAAPLNAHVGEEVELQLDGVDGVDNHRLENLWLGLTGEPGGQWVPVDGYGPALEALTSRGWSAVDAFTNQFVDDVDLLIGAGEFSIGQSSSYRIPWTKTNRELAQRRAQLRSAFARPAGSVAELGDLLGQIEGVQPGSEVEDHLRRLLIAREMVRNEWTVADIAPRINEYSL